MEVYVTRPEPIPTPPPRVNITRYGKGVGARSDQQLCWSLTFDEAEFLHAQLGQVLRNNGRLTLG